MMRPSPTTLNRQTRGVILDFALGAAIVALIPIPYTIFLKIIIVPVLLGLLVKRILRLWQGYKPDVVAKLSLFVGLAGGMLLGVLAWLGGVALGVTVPWLAGLAPGFAVFALFWGVGQAIKQCYVSGLPGVTEKPYLVDQQDET